MQNPFSIVCQAVTDKLVPLIFLGRQFFCGLGHLEEVGVVLPGAGCGGGEQLGGTGCD